MRSQARGSSLKKKKQLREEMQGFKGSLPNAFHLNGTYTENGETKSCSYKVQIGSDGALSGSAEDDDGVATVHGKVSITVHGNGIIRWNEHRIGADIEVEGSICNSAGDIYDIKAEYLAEQTSGSSMRASYVTGSLILVSSGHQCESDCSGLATGGLTNYAQPGTPFNVQIIPGTPLEAT